MALVLIAEDNEPIAFAFQALVRALGHAAIVVPDGEQALAFLRDRPADLLLQDVMMPRVSGLDVLRAMRADPATPWPPVVVCSANAQAREQALSLGAAAFLVKTDPAAIGEAIRRHVGGGGSLAPDRAT